MNSSPSFVSAEDVAKITPLLVSLIPYRYEPVRFRETLLDKALKLISVKGPSSVIQLTHFFSAGGRYCGSKHRNIPLGAFGEKLVEWWVEHISSGQSVIERALYAEYQAETQRSGKAPTVGFGRLGELVREEAWKDSVPARLAHKAGVGDMAYLWVMCAPGDLWALCLRRKKAEGNFTPYECNLLRAFGHGLYSIRNNWYLESYYQVPQGKREILEQLSLGNDWDVALINKLSEIDLRNILLISQGLSYKEAALERNVSERTVQNQMQDIRGRLGVIKNSEILPRLAGKLKHYIEEAAVLSRKRK